jgi:hypothetical protein
MSIIRGGVVVALLFVLPLDAQVRNGSLVVLVVSIRADYVVIGAESRQVDTKGKFVDDCGCKIIALGKDTLFYETGSSEIGVYHGKPWSSKGAARSVYMSSKRRDATSLSRAWGILALRWFHMQSPQSLRTIARPPHGSLVVGGFINFDKNGTASAQNVEISYDSAKSLIIGQPSEQAHGQIGASGIAEELVQEFFARETPKAINALGPIGRVRAVAEDAMIDVMFVQNAIKFAMDNANEYDKPHLGGDIDIAIIRNGGAIQWISRKPRCSQEDQKPTQPNKQK